ncbi:MAG: hypothetical protein JW912_07630 [Sedimentisphaerales bacterium]|nr:hypothetical protein [Sedimentisphaerales bacterium]
MEAEKIFEKINQMAVDIAQIKTKLQMLPSPPKQPCQWYYQLRKEFDEHIREHKRASYDWRECLIRNGVDLLKTAIVAATGMLIAFGLGGRL